jgi:AhpD family alkylhydroperoxidase
MVSMRGILLVTILFTLRPAGAAEVPLKDLNERARGKVHATARVPLAPETAGSVPTPNFVRALAQLPAAGQPMANLFRTVLYSGAVEPEIKMGMGLRIAQIYASPYVAVHLQRLLRASERGRTGEENGVALRYAESLTRDIHGVSDEDFRRLRGYFNDSQVAELTMTVCFFNYFTRFVEAVNLPVETWALEPPSAAAVSKYAAPAARVGLISNPEMEWAATIVKAPAAAGGPGLGVVNSQRAMFRSPEIAMAWRAYGEGVRQKAVVSREILLQVSFAVSMANGCRYCTLHQVQGLRRVGVSPAKLVQMKKDDSALTPRELTAVEFARKLTREPASITDADYGKLRKEFGEQGALEVVLQTCNFAFMNRFTDGLRLPSEDEAVRTYREVYGTDWK